MATTKKYTDLSYRDFLIPKKNGKPRRISAPSKELLKYQHNLMPGLYAYHKKKKESLIARTFSMDLFLIVIV